MGITQIRRFLAVLSTLFFFSIFGCVTLFLPEDAKFGTLKGKKDRENKLIQTVEPFQTEYDHFGGPPKVCLALSGGGIRSALYSMGVLMRYGRPGVLKNFDIISSSSGGGYALGWFLTQFYKHKSNEVFTDLSKSQDLVNESLLAVNKNYGKWGDIVSDGIAYGSSVPMAIAFLPMTVGHPGTSLARAHYQNTLESAFLSEGSLYCLLGCPQTYAPTLGEIGQTMRTLGSPLFVFNATVIGENWKTVDLENTIFEWTPFHYGSAGTGYKSLPEDISLAEVVATSGAAIDIPFENANAGTFRNYSGVTFGKALSYFYDDLSYLWLSDAGHSENLAAFSLVRRGCKTIIVIDAEEDSDYKFVGYKNLKALIGNPKGLNKDFKVQRIEEHLVQESHSENSSKKVFIPPWMEGEIKGRRGSFDSVQRQRVLYLKLSFDRNLYSEAIQNTLNLLAGQKEKKENILTMSKVVMKEWDTTSFPHYPTANQHISKQAKFALFSLGLYHGESPVGLEGL